MKNKSCKFAIVAAAAVVLLTGCGSDERNEKPVMQTGTAGTNATTSVVTTMSTTVPTTVPTIAPTTVPATITSTLPSVPVAPTSPSGEVTLTTSAPTTAPTVAPTTVPTTVTTQPEHECTFVQIEVDATCTANGYTSMKCACGKTVQIVTSNPLGHKYGEWTSNNDATCVKDGTKTRKCQRCGEPDVKTDEGSALGHDWVYQESESYPPDSPAGHGRIYYQCSHCKDWDYDKWYMDDEMIEQYCREVEQVVLAELNRYRVEAGQKPLVYLPGLSEVCQYRAYQIHQRKGQDVHNDDDIHEAFNKFEYGVYVDAAEKEQWRAEHIPGYVPKDVTEADNYWTPGGTEAVCSSNGVPWQTAEEKGIIVMESLRNSTGHWSYLGSDLYSYVGIGVYCRANGIYTNIWVCSTNYE